MSNQHRKDFDSVESRRSTASRRRMSPARRLYYSYRLRRGARLVPESLGRFHGPKPFSCIVLAIGQPYPIPADAPLDKLEPHRLAVQEAVMSIMRESQQVFEEVRA